ncbi:hypothetical protein OYC64_014086 [Pagothenia borchgrevinki]|uniref:C2H2-type domain-containing protein n=1 Tax=Pagothenia borchgrevinki TaxID=8213 RepID=A0ABD2FW77_PAGBO
MVNDCLLCKMPYLALNKHLQRNHSVHNADERRILLLMANGRMNIRLHPCIISGCNYSGTRLDRHMDRDHVELSREKINVAVQQVKMKMAKKELHDLRLTNPDIGMITSWDV